MKIKQVFFTFAVAALLIAGAVIGVRLYVDSQLLTTEEDLIAALKTEAEIDSGHTVALVDSVTLANSVTGEDVVLFWFIDETAHTYYAMYCDAVNEHAYRFKRLAAPSYYNENIAWDTGPANSYLVNDPRCVEIKITNDLTGEEQRIPVDSVPFVFDTKEIILSNYSLGFYDGNGNDLQFQ